jgi:sigma-B regulation protein RsbU (phosphoserine phosphatase)
MDDLFTILIIDDDKTVRLFLQRILQKKMQARVIEASNGTDGIQYITEFKPDLVFIDLMMPGLGGIEVIEVIRIHPEVKDTPMVVVTSVDTRETIASLAGLKILDYILKPMDILHTGIRIRKLIEDNQGLFRRKLPVFIENK